MKNWTPPRTPWGDPDLQGYYFYHSSYTPLERPAALGDKAFYTEEEALAAFKKAVETDAEVDPRVVHYDWKEYGMDAWQSERQAEPAHVADCGSAGRSNSASDARGAAAPGRDRRRRTRREAPT